MNIVLNEYIHQTYRRREEIEFSDWIKINRHFVCPCQLFILFFILIPNVPITDGTFFFYYLSILKMNRFLGFLLLQHMIDRLCVCVCIYLIMDKIVSWVTIFLSIYCCFFSHAILLKRISDFFFSFLLNL